MSEIDNVPESLLREFMRFMLPRKLGSGMSRDVYVHPTDPTKVIKMENSRDNFQNVREWLIWEDVQWNQKISKWLAPCHSISENGTFLVMSRARDISAVEVPATLPKFLTDHKLANFGMLDGKFVCRDYGTSVLNFELTRSKWCGEGSKDYGPQT